jgi:hypothetical protein
MDVHTPLEPIGMIHSIGVCALRAQTIFVEDVKHLLVAIVSAAPPTMKHVRIVLRIVGHALTSMYVEMEYANLWKHVQPVPTIVGHARQNPSVETGNAMAQKTVAHVLETAVDPVDSLRVPKGKAWMDMETVCRLRQIVPRRSLEVYGQGLNVVAQVELY